VVKGNENFFYIYLLKLQFLERFEFIIHLQVMRENRKISVRSGVFKFEL
jgi:hypothetical protein